MNYKLCELYNKYTTLLNYEQNTHFIQIAPCFRGSFHCFGMLQVRENEISLRNSSGGPEYLRTLKGTLLTMQCKMDVNKTIYPFYTTKKLKCLDLASASARGPKEGTRDPFEKP